MAVSSFITLTPGEEKNFLQDGATCYTATSI